MPFDSMSDQIPLLARIYRRAAEIVLTGWARGSIAEDAHGRDVTAASPDAVSWCAIGACLRARHELGVTRGLSLKPLAELLPPPRARLPFMTFTEASAWLNRRSDPRDSITKWNDHEAPNKKAVAKKLNEAADRVIAAAYSKEKVDAV